MPVIARDAVASDHLVYAWPFPIGPEELEVACAEDEQVVMCPSWTVGDRLGPGRHRWRTPDPSRPVSAYFVLTAPVEVSFDMLTSFALPTTGLPVRLRAAGALHVRCADPGLLVAQFVGLPFDHVNDGIVRSVSRSVERMLARLLTRRVVMAGTPAAVTDPQMLANIVEELVAYNPAAGAVFGVELMRFGHLAIYADDGTPAWLGPHAPPANEWGNGRLGPNGETERVTPPMTFPRSPSAPSDAETLRRHPSVPPTAELPIPPVPRHTSTPPLGTASGEIETKPVPPSPRVLTTPLPQPNPIVPPPIPPPRKAMPMDVVKAHMEPIDASEPSTPPPTDEPRGAILGIGMGQIGSGSIASGEIQSKVAPGARVLVPGPDGLMQSATVRQLLQGYYELEVGGSGETIWVPVSGVVPEH